MEKESISVNEFGVASIEIPCRTHQEIFLLSSYLNKVLWFPWKFEMRGAKSGGFKYQFKISFYEIHVWNEYQNVNISDFDPAYFSAFVDALLDGASYWAIAQFCSK